MRNFKKLLTIFATAAILFVSCGNASVDANGCYYDIDDAVKAAEKNNQDIMIIVTIEGDDLQSEDFLNKVVRTPAFKTDVASKFAVVCMDFSQSTYESSVVKDDAKATEKKAAERQADLIQKNTKYAAKLNVQQTPVVYILSKEQYLINGLFYDDENRTVEGFKAMLDEKASSIEDIHKMIYQTKIGNAEEKVTAIDELYEATAPDYRLFLIDLIESVKKIDPSNTTGLVGKYVYASADIRSNLAAINGDAKAAIQAYLDLENEETVPAEVRQEAIYTAAYLAASAGIADNAVVISYLEKSIQVAPDSEKVPAIRRVIEALSAQE